MSDFPNSASQFFGIMWRILAMTVFIGLMIVTLEKVTDDPSPQQRRNDFVAHCVGEGGDPTQCVKAARSLMPVTRQECEKYTAPPTIAECKELPNG